MKPLLDQVRWGIIGAGDVCEVKSAPAMQEIANSTIEVVMRRDEEKLVDYASRHGIANWTTNALEVIQNPKVNAIYIATPPAFHAPYTVLAAQHGKAVYVEKPMARTHQECLEMIDACGEAGVPLFVAYYRRALPHFLKVKALLDSEAIGDPRFVRIELYQHLNPELEASGSNWRVNPEIARGGYFYDLASHQLDLLDFFFGPIKDAKGYKKNQAGLYQAEDIVTGTFEFESGVLGTGSWCFSAAPADQLDRIVLYGSEGHIEFTCFGSTDILLKTHQGMETFCFEMPKHIQQPLIQEVVIELAGEGNASSTGTSGARANQVMEWISA